MKKTFDLAFLVYDTSLTGGAEVITKQLAKELHKIYNVTIISLFQENDIEHLGYHHIYLSKETKSIPLKIFDLSKNVRNIIKEKHIDILFSVTAGVNGVAQQAVKKTNTKFVYVEHSNLMNQTYGKKHFYRQRLGAKYATRIVTLTDRDKENFIKAFKIPPNNISVIPNWFENVNVNFEYDLYSKKIISVGRLVKIKGYDEALEVAKKIFAKHDDWIWDIYGEGSERPHLETKIKELCLGNHVFLKGNVGNIKDIYQEYSLFVMCSLFEGIPLVMLEAQSAGLPVVSFDCQTGPREIIMDKINGDLIRERNVDDMVESINNLIEMPEIRKTYSKHSMDNMERFSKAIVFEKWKQLIEELI